MGQRVTTLLLLVGLSFAGVALATRLSNWRWPANQQGYEPRQPIAFSHRLHAGELQIACAHCHNSAERGPQAGFPPASVCMNCHKTVTGPMGGKGVSPELRKLYDFVGLDEKLQPDPRKMPQPIPWVRVHKLPDHACFDHRAHVKAGVACQHCHGPVETMERIRQESNLSMGWCVNCHREANRTGVRGQMVKASLDCVACHR